MGVGRIFHKIKIFFQRLKGTRIPTASPTKRYGDYGEDQLVSELTSALPSCRVKRNIIISASDANAEIDCLVLCQNKLFAIEVKRWKGYLTETDYGFVQRKNDRWTGELHTKYLRSPFKQLNRAIYLLRKQISGKVWINDIVYFENDKFNGISTYSQNTWFDNIVDLVNYIKNDGEITYGYNEAMKFFDKCVAADFLYEKKSGKTLRCSIMADSLNFETDQGLITRNEISQIHIVHHLSYDEFNITMRDGSRRRSVIENGKITVEDGGQLASYSLCKLDYIKVG